jgi:hypothetical protein
MVFFLVFSVHFLGTICYATRLVGARTKLLALTISLFNIISLFANTFNALQTPLLAKFIESDGINFNGWTPLHLFRGLILTASVASITGALFIPTVQEILTRAVFRYYNQPSFIKLITSGLKPHNLYCLMKNRRCPTFKSISGLLKVKQLPYSLFFFHMIAVSFLTTGVLSALYYKWLCNCYHAISC